MKTKPSLFFTSLCVLLSQTNPVLAQQQPRFGYGSAPRADVVPAPAKATRPPVKERPAAVPVIAKPKVAQTAKQRAKPVSPRATEESTRQQAPKKLVVASRKSKTTASGTTAKSPSKVEIARKEKAVTGRERPAAKANPDKATAAATTRKGALPGESARLREKSNPMLETAFQKTTPRKDPNPETTTNPRATAPQPRGSAGLLADVSTPIEIEAPTGFHFFGSPIVIPSLPKNPGGDKLSGDAGKPGDRASYVDVFAARRSLLALAQQPEKAGASQAGASTSAEGLGVTESDQPSALEESDQTPPATEPSLISSEIPSLMVDSPVLTPDEKGATIPEETSVSIAGSMKVASSVVSIPTPALEASPLEETDMPAPRPSEDESGTPLGDKLEVANTPAPASEESGAMPEETSSASPGDDALDLSERERAFVRSLAEAAGSVTPASAHLNADLPSSTTIAATSVINQIPAETVTSFSAVPEAAKTTLRHAIASREKEPALEAGNEMMPASPEKMPDSLPAFKAPPTGKIDVQSDRQADYDQANNKVIFTGKVEMNSAAIRLRADRVEVFLKQGGGGMERVEASGNVLMRTRESANAPGQMASAGRAIYNLKTGEILLSDWPKIQETSKSHISTDPSTKMYLFTDGRLRTDGPNRTILGGN